MENIYTCIKGVDIILGLGHSGYEKDKEIAEKVPYIDAVIGGHTHSFLYSGGKKNPSNNIIEGDYPTIVTKSNGKQAAVVQAGVNILLYKNGNGSKDRRNKLLKVHFISKFI